MYRYITIKHKFIGYDAWEHIIEYLEPLDFLKTRLAIRSIKSKKLSDAFEDILAPESCLIFFQFGFETIFLAKLVPQKVTYKKRNEIIQEYLDANKLEAKILTTEYNNRMKVWKFQQIHGQKWNSFIVPPGYERLLSFFLLSTLFLPKETSEVYKQLRCGKWDSRTLWIPDEQLIYKKMIWYYEFDVRRWEYVHLETGEIMFLAPSMALEASKVLR